MLDGLVVIDLTTFLSGPFATQVLGDLGARVIKVEAPAGDSTRQIPPHFYRGESAYYLSANRNKESVVLNLKDPKGMAVLWDLIATADVVIDNFRPGVTERLGLDFASIHSRFPRVVVCSITGYGLTGPGRDRPAYDMVIQAMSGAMSMTGEVGGRPVRSGVPMGDLAAGLYAVIAINAALVHRERTGEGRYLDISMLDSQISLLSYQGVYYLMSGEVPGLQGRGHVSFPTYRAFTAKDGRDVMVTANTEDMWRRLCVGLGLDGLVEDPRFKIPHDRFTHRQALWELLDARFLTEDAATWLNRLGEAGVPVAPVNTVDQALDDPQVRAREMVLEVEHALGGTVRLLGNPVKSGAPAPAASPPLLGQHTVEILRGLGYDEDKIAHLLQSGAAAAYPEEPPQA